MPRQTAMFTEGQLNLLSSPTPGATGATAISQHRLPTPVTFRKSLLIVLGTQVGLKADHFVPGNRDMQLAIIREAGFDPDNLAQYGDPAQGWRLDGITNPPGFLRHVVLSYGDSRRKQNPPLTIAGAKGQWGLTEAGVTLARSFIRAKRLAAKEKNLQQCNGTADFLNKHLLKTGGYSGSFMRTMRATVAKKLPVSYASQQVDDHIQTCFTKLIARDSLTAWLAAGNSIEDRHLAMFIVRSAFSEVRDSAGNPVCRELYGARTDSERKKDVQLPAITDSRVIWSTDNESGESPHWVDLVDDTASPEEQVAFASIMKQVYSVIQEKKPQTAERFIKIVNMRSEGLSLKEIAEEEGVSPFRAASLMAEVRRVLRLGKLDKDFELAS